MPHLTDDAIGQPPLPAFRQESGLLWEDAEGQVVNIGTYFLCLLFCWLILPALYALYRFCKTFCHEYSMTDQRLKESSGILMRTTDVLELYRVKDITVEQPFLQRLMGCGSVILITSDRSTPRVVLSAITNPLAVADLLRGCVETCRVAKGVREID